MAHTSPMDPTAGMDRAFSPAAHYPTTSNASRYDDDSQHNTAYYLSNATSLAASPSPPASSSSVGILGASQQPSSLGAFLKANKLSQYTQSLADAGFEDMEDLHVVCKDKALLGILIPLPGHQAKFLRVMSEYYASAAGRKKRIQQQQNASATSSMLLNQPQQQQQHSSYDPTSAYAPTAPSSFRHTGGASPSSLNNTQQQLQQSMSSSGHHHHPTSSSANPNASSGDVYSPTHHHNSMTAAHSNTLCSGGRPSSDSNNDGQHIDHNGYASPNPQMVDEMVGNALAAGGEVTASGNNTTTTPAHCNDAYPDNNNTSSYPIDVYDSQPSTMHTFCHPPPVGDDEEEVMGYGSYSGGGGGPFNKNRSFQQQQRGGCSNNNNNVSAARLTQQQRLAVRHRSVNRASMDLPDGATIAATNIIIHNNNNAGGASGSSTSGSNQQQQAASGRGQSTLRGVASSSSLSSPLHHPHQNGGSPSLASSSAYPFRAGDPTTLHVTASNRDHGMTKKIVVRRYVDFKIVVVGQGGVGKTALIHRLVNHTFNSRIKCTIGVEFTSKTVQVTRYFTAPKIAGIAQDKEYEIITDVNLQFWDIAGQEDCGNATRTYYHGAKAAIICYDVLDPLSLSTAIRWKRDLEMKVKFGGGQLDIPAILVGNKCDAVPYVLPLKRKIRNAAAGGISPSSSPTTTNAGGDGDFPAAATSAAILSNTANSHFVLKDRISSKGSTGVASLPADSPRASLVVEIPPTQYCESSFDPSTILTPPETVEECQNLVNAFKFAGHHFVSAKNGSKMDEMIDYVVTCILKMDPHGTDQVPPAILRNPELASARTPFNGAASDVQSPSPLRGRVEIVQKPKKKKKAGFSCIV